MPRRFAFVKFLLTIVKISMTRADFGPTVRTFCTVTLSNSKVVTFNHFHIPFKFGHGCISPLKFSTVRC